MSLSVLSHSPVLKWRAPGLLRHKTTEPHVKGEKTHGSQAVQESQIFRTLAVHFVWETCVKTLKIRGGLLQQLALIILILSSSMRLQSILRYCIKETLSLCWQWGRGGAGRIRPLILWLGRYVLKKALSRFPLNYYIFFHKKSDMDNLLVTDGSGSHN